MCMGGVLHVCLSAMCMLCPQVRGGHQIFWDTLQKLLAVSWVLGLELLKEQAVLLTTYLFNLLFLFLKLFHLLL